MATQTSDKVHNLREKYPDKVPVIVSRDKKSTNIQDIGTIKYLVQDNITVGQFVYLLRKKIKIDSIESIYLYAKYKNKSIALNNTLEMITVFEKYKNVNDNKLYLIYAGENTFG